MFDRLLVRPTGLGLVDALTAAQAEANSRWHVLAQTPADWTRELAGVKAERSGRRIWSKRGGACRGTVRLSWWTDHRGQRHFRVIGLASVDPGDRNPVLDDTTPPVVDLYPATAIVVGRSGWVLLCGCGEVMPANAPGGWMGTRCVACHDREQDGEPLPEVGRMYDLGPASEVVPLPEGERFLVRHEQRVEVRELRGGAAALEWGDVDALDVTPDGQRVACTDRQRVQVREWPGGAVTAAIEVHSIDRPVFSPSGALLAMRTYHVGEWAVWGCDEEGQWTPRQTHPQAQYVTWSADERRMAVVGTNQLQIRREDGDEMPFESPQTPIVQVTVTDEQFEMGIFSGLPGNVTVGRFSAGGDQFSCLAHHGESTVRAPRFVAARWRWTGRHWARLADVPITSAVVGFSPDGRWLAVGEGVIEVIDLREGRSAGWIGWPVRGASADPTPWMWRDGTPARFLPDGRSLVMRHAGRMRVVPWALLLGAGG